MIIRRGFVEGDRDFKRREQGQQIKGVGQHHPIGNHCGWQTKQPPVARTACLYVNDAGSSGLWPWIDNAKIDDRSDVQADVDTVEGVCA
jgi:hypothetical protein